MNALSRIVALGLLIALPFAASAAADSSAAAGNPRVEVTTNLGSFVLELWPAEAPLTVENFLAYVDRGFYDGLVFHRVIPDFMIQAGGYDAAMDYREPMGPVRNESVGGPRNLRSTIAMARQRNPDSADAQFFVNVKDNGHLDADGQRPGYTVFGQVVAGMDIVDRISLVRTGVRAGMRDVPLQPVVIESAARLGD
ncbi:MAG: peptidylprolyl isomerase [Pseudomonadales bacterium]|nr:peptidylprolyl isomerase [Pseudomonadales bacterium]